MATNCVLKVTRGVYDSAASDAKLLEFDYILIAESGDYVGSFNVGAEVNINAATPAEFCDTQGAAFAETMAAAIAGGTAKKTDLTLTEVNTAVTQVKKGVTRYSEHY